MSDDRSEQVREMAYRIWQEEGQPEGREEVHWAQAEAEIGEQAGAAPAEPPAAGLDPTAGTDTSATAPLVAAASSDAPVEETATKPTD